MSEIIGLPQFVYKWIENVKAKPCAWVPKGRVSLLLQLMAHFAHGRGEGCSRAVARRSGLQ